MINLTLTKREQSLIAELRCDFVQAGTMQWYSVHKFDCLMHKIASVFHNNFTCVLTNSSFFVSHTEKPVSVELSCGAGPSHVVLEPGLPLLLDCNLGASDSPFNVTWLQDGQPLPLEGGDFMQYLDNGSLLLLPASEDGHPSRGVEGGYSCMSASALGALTSRTVNVLLASKCPAESRTAVAC